MKKVLSLVSLMLVLFAASAHAQFPGFPGFQPPKPPKAISMDPNVRAPKAEIGNFGNKYYQIGTSMTYDFNSENCKLTIQIYSKQEDVLLEMKVDYDNEYADFLKFVKKTSKEANKMLKNATTGNTRQKMDLGKVPSLRGSIIPKASTVDADAPTPQLNLGVDGHFIVEDEIATWQLKFTMARMGWGGRREAAQPNDPAFAWTIRTPKELENLLGAIDKATLSGINTELKRQGKELEDNYGK